MWSVFVLLVSPISTLLDSPISTLLDSLILVLLAPVDEPLPPAPAPCVGAEYARMSAPTATPITIVIRKPCFVTIALYSLLEILSSVIASSIIVLGVPMLGLILVP